MRNVFLKKLECGNCNATRFKIISLCKIFVFPFLIKSFIWYLLLKFTQTINQVLAKLPKSVNIIYLYFHKLAEKGNLLGKFSENNCHCVILICFSNNKFRKIDIVASVYFCSCWILFLFIIYSVNDFINLLIT